MNEAMCLSKNGRAIIEKIPRERVLTETDAPYNERTNIRALLDYMKMSETVVLQNFKSLLDRIRTE